MAVSAVVRVDWLWVRGMMGLESQSWLGPRRVPLASDWSGVAPAYLQILCWRLSMVALLPPPQVPSEM